MKMSFNLNLTQTQKLVMTPELRQAIEILQYNAVELNDFIQEELLSNPVLDKQQEEFETSEKEAEKQDADGEGMEKVDIDWKEYLNDYEPHHSNSKMKEVKDQVSFEAFVACESTLVDYLMEQFQFTVFKNPLFDAGVYIIENIDGNGYLFIKNDEVAEKFKITDDDVEEIIQTIQTFEPAGVGARDLKECLSIQVQMKEINNKLVIELINDYLDDIASNRIGKIAKQLSARVDDVQIAADIIKKLEPKPGRLFASLRNVRYIVPDVNIVKIDEEYVIQVNEYTAPRLRISGFYQKILKESEMEKNASEYIQERLQSAIRIIKSIEQRKNTIYRVVEAILECQHDFFEGGTVHLKTLTLKDIAEIIGVHESTVSRAVSGKYLQCPRGVYEIKYFFQSGVSSDMGDGVSAESIKTMIKEFIDGENQAKPHSDQYLSNELNKVGIKVSRRTIAKYRDELGILSSSKRKRY